MKNRKRANSIIQIMYFTFPAWFYTILIHFPAPSYIATVLFWILAFICVYGGKRALISYWDLLFLYGLIWILFFLKFYHNPEMSFWWSDETNSFSVARQIIFPGSGIFAYAIIRVSGEKEIFLKNFRIIGIILFLYNFYLCIDAIKTGYFVYEQFGIQRVTTYNMSVGYGFLASAIFLSVDYIFTKWKYNIVIVALAFVMMVMYGNRVPIFIYVIFCLMMLLFIENSNRKKTRRLIFLLVGLIILYLVMFPLGGFEALINYLASKGVRSRVLEAFINKNVADMNGRNDIWEKAVELIKKKPYFGYGVFGERNAIYGINVKWGYSHNLFLEMLVDFGWVIGAPLLVVLFWNVRYILVFSKNKVYKALIIAFLSMSLELLFSNSFWFHAAFWALLAIIVDYRRKEKNVRYGRFSVTMNRRMRLKSWVH